MSNSAKNGRFFKNFLKAIFCFVLGLGFTWIAKDILAYILFGGKSFVGRNDFYKGIFLLFFTIVFSAVFWIISQPVKDFYQIVMERSKSKFLIISRPVKDFYQIVMKRNKSIFLIVFIVLWLCIGISIMYYGWNATWGKLYIPSMFPPFADMRSVQGSLMSISWGHNPQIINPGDPWNRVMNYPKIWIEIAKFFELGNETHFILFVGIYIIAYIFSCFVLLKQNPSLYFLLSMFSGASLLAVERGNNDVIIFVLIFLGLQCSSSHFRAMLVLLVTSLKIYPAVSLLGLVKKSKVIVILIVMIVCYLIGNWSEMKLILSGNNADGQLSYGFDSIILLINSIIFNNKFTIDYKILKSMFFLLSLSAVIILETTKKRDLLITPFNMYRRDLFMSGAAIYCFTYLSSKNWDYRLIFLLMCIPYVLSIENKVVKHITLCCILLSQNVLIIGHLGKYAIYCTTVSKYYLFLIFSAFLTKELGSYSSIFPEFVRRFTKTIYNDILQNGGILDKFFNNKLKQIEK